MIFKAMRIRPVLFIAALAVSLPVAPSVGQDDEFPWPIALQWQEDEPWVFRGRVVDSDGKPVENAKVAFSAFVVQFLFNVPVESLGEVTTDRDGQFELTVPSLPYYQWEWLDVVAGAPGHGLVVQRLKTADRQHDLTISLAKEQPLHGTLIDADGRPAKGVKMRLQRLGLPGGPYATRPGKPTSVWPEVLTDEQGRFTLPALLSQGLEGTIRLTFDVDDERFAPELSFQVSASGEETTHRLAPARWVEGTVLRDDKKTPLTDTWLMVVVSDRGLPGDSTKLGRVARTNANGRFRLRCGPEGKGVHVYVYPPAGEPYPRWVSPDFPWPEGAQTTQLNIEVPRGVLLRGKIVDAETGEGIGGAGIENQVYHTGNPKIDRESLILFHWGPEHHPAPCGPDGSFAIGVPAIPGRVLVKAPTLDYVSRPVRDELYHSNARMTSASPGRPSVAAEGFLKIDPNPGQDVLDVTIPLRRGVTVRGRIEGPEGEAVSDRTYVLDRSHHFPHFYGQIKPVPVRDGEFELPGLDPEKSHQVYVLDPENHWGATVEINAKHNGEARIIRLAKCGSATVRLANTEDQPWANHRLLLGKPQVILSVASWQSQMLDGYWRLRNGHTDGEGRITMPNLIPGAPYRLTSPLALRLNPDEPGTRLKIDFSVEPGEHQTLPDLIVSWPPKRPSPAGEVEDSR